MLIALSGWTIFSRITAPQQQHALLALGGGCNEMLDPSTRQLAPLIFLPFARSLRLI